MTVRDARPEDAEELREIIKKGQDHYRENMGSYPDAISLEEMIRRGQDKLKAAEPAPKKSFWQRLMFWR
jgi:hypothetical protein